jgi:UDP-2,3-diacylglucosamine pyrophosphatase LpxH
MITDVREERLLVTSDTHIGSLFCNARPKVLKFVEFAAKNKFNVCFNGDGIDVLMTSLPKMAHETSSFLSEFRRFMGNYDITVYYTVGNHDIILEHYLADWGNFHVIPFLNVSSGNKRIRVEHGHVYDPFFTKHPDMQTALTHFATYVCRIYPPWYDWYKKYLITKYKLTYKFSKDKRPDLPARMMESGEGHAFVDAAEELAQRGFDAIIFGHTHNPGILPLKSSPALYFNTGSWFEQPYYAQILNGQIELKEWNS